MASPVAPDPQDWIRAYIGVQKLADREILKILQDAERDVSRQITRILARHPVGASPIGDFVRVAQLREIRQVMLRQQTEIFKRLGDVVNENRARAALLGIALNNRLDAHLFAMVGDTQTARALADSLQASLSRSVEVATARMTQSRIPLSQRIYNNDVALGSRIDRAINSALARGLSAREFAAEATSWFSPNTPGGVRYASMRLARTEINNAFHAMSVEAADKPWVTGMRWNLSRSHPKADDCDTLAHEDGFKMGAGVYPVRDVPRKPHPQCLCYVVPVVVDDDTFIDTLFAGGYDPYLNGRGVVRGAEPGRATPLAAVPAKAAVAAKAPTPAQILAKARRESQVYVRVINKMAPGPAREAAIREMRQQAKLTPYTARKLNTIHGEGSASAYGREFINTQGQNTLAYYRLAQRDIFISPGHFDDLEAMTKLSRTDHATGWHSHSDRPGLESTLAHEYGHHVNFRFNDGFGNYTPEQARRIFGVVSKEMGLRMPTIHPARGSNRIGLTWNEADDWVKENKAAIERLVSKYGAHSQAEMFAEIWAEYTTSARPRGWILKIGKVMQRMAEEATKP